MEKWLNDLIKDLPHKLLYPQSTEPVTDTIIRGIACDSRKVLPGDLFFALAGAKANGANYVPEAISAGAAAIVTENILPHNILQVTTNNPLQFMSNVSARFYNHPSHELFVVGVTGTNGKTTITYLLESIFNEARIKNGVIGTINCRICGSAGSPHGGSASESFNTTPLSCHLQAYLRKAVDMDAKAMSIEVSSHALALHRVDDVEFDTAIFTNLTQDHLDFHQTMENYMAAKLKLFQKLGCETSKQGVKTAIINYDDPWVKNVLIKSLDKKVTCVTYSANNTTPDESGNYTEKTADFYATGIKLSLNGAQFRLHHADGELDVFSPLIGLHNVYNVLAAIAAAKMAKIAPPAIIKGIHNLKAVPGRLERIEGHDFTVFVDYAHTEDALRHTLQSLKLVAPNSSIITVFGCGGDRDRGKRPAMGEVSSELSDYTIVTSDNPRSEEPQKITLEVEAGIKRTGPKGRALKDESPKGRECFASCVSPPERFASSKTNYEIIIDRAKAIEKALSLARSGDIVLLAGKGHETYQIIGDKKIPFDDRVIAREMLKQ